MLTVALGGIGGIAPDVNIAHLLTILVSRALRSRINAVRRVLRSRIAVARRVSCSMRYTVAHSRPVNGCFAQLKNCKVLHGAAQCCT